MVIESANAHAATTQVALEAGGGTVLRMGGFSELTARNGGLFRSVVGASLNGHSSIDIELSQTTFMDCSGLGALIALRKLARDRGVSMRLLNPTLAVQRLFGIVCAEQMFDIVHTSK